MVLFTWLRKKDYDDTMTSILTELM